MRRAVTLKDREHAATLHDYLLTLGIETRVQEEDQGWSLWALDEDKLDQARQQAEKFVADPDDPRYAASARRAEELRKQRAALEAQFRRNVIDMRRAYSGPPQRTRPLTAALIAASIGVAIVTNLGSQVGSLAGQPPGLMDQLLITLHPADPMLQEVRHGEVWRLVTPMLVHFGPLHLIFNMVMFFQFGSAVEMRRRTPYFALMVLVLAVASNLAQWWWTVFRGSPNPLFGGMSGVLYGLFGYIWMKARYEPQSGFLMDYNTVFILVAWMLLCVFGLVGRIANAAHVAGLLTGMAWGYAPTFWQRQLRRLRPR